MEDNKSSCELINLKLGRGGAVKLPDEEHVSKFIYLNYKFVWYKKDQSKVTWTRSWSLKNHELANNFHKILFNKCY